LTNIFICHGSQAVTCLGYATQGDLSKLRAQLIETLCAVQKREHELHEPGGDKKLKKATAEELNELDVRLSEALQLIRSQKP
jgi:hypothetical protein